MENVISLTEIALSHEYEYLKEKDTYNKFRDIYLAKSDRDVLFEAFLDTFEDVLMAGVPIDDEVITLVIREPFKLEYGVDILEMLIFREQIRIGIRLLKAIGLEM